MRPVLVLVERRTAGALLTVARRLGVPVAVWCGPVDAAGIAALGRFGAPTIWHVTGSGTDGNPATDGDPATGGYPATVRVEALVELARRGSPAAILVASGRTGNEVAARVAVRLDSGIVTEAVDVRPGPDGPIAVRSTRAVSCRVESTVVRGTPVITVRPEAVAPVAAPVAPVVHRLRLTVRDPVRGTRPGRPDLATAAVVVAGGRGIGSRDRFDLVGRVADALGGAAGGSRTATELGWCPRDAMIDQIGRIVHPRLYLGLGVSGSARHRAGMRTAGTIVAIDRDPAAPIFRIADLGVVGDLHEVATELLAEIRRRTETGARRPR